MAASSATVVTPTAASRWAMRVPMPQIASGGLAPKCANQVSWVIR